MGYDDDMTRERREAIYSFAEKIRKVLELGVPVDLCQVIESLGGEIWEEELDRDISGKINKVDEKFMITLNSLHPDNRKNFTLAHELGHLFLHMGYITDPEKWANINEYVDSPYYRIGYSEEEYEANQFAGALLMPRDEYKKFLDANGDGNRINISKISRYFNVSDEAALTRGKWLGFFRWN